MIEYIMMGLGIVLLLAAAALLGFGILWLTAWINQLSKFVMQIYKDESAHISAQYTTMAAILFASSFFLWRLAEIILTKL